MSSKSINRNPRTLAEARNIIAQLRGQKTPELDGNLSGAVGNLTKPNSLGVEGKPTVDSILANLVAKLITFSEAKAGLQAAAKNAKSGAEQNKAFKALARVQKAEALDKLASLKPGKRLI